jgi:putative MFS transporter
MGEYFMNTELINLDDLPLNRFHIKITALTFGAHFTDGYALGTIGFAIVLMAKQIYLSPKWMGLLGASALMGLFLGSIILGGIAGHIGRQKIFLFNFVIITFASALQFFVNIPIQLFFLRILIGFALGGDYAVGVALLAEFAPKRHRGVLLGALSVVWTVGYVCSNIIGILCTSSSSTDLWRWMLASAAIPAGLVLLLRLGTPESPRWLASKGRSEEAHQIIVKYFGPNVVLDEKVVTTKSSYLDLFNKKNWKRTTFGGLFFCTLVIPYFAIYTFLPLILGKMGLAENNAVDLALNFVLIIGGLAGLWLTVKLTRRGFTIYSYAIMAVALGLLTFTHNLILSVTSFLIFTFVMTAICNLTGVYPPELFPTELRSEGVGMCTAISRLGAAVGTYLLPVGIYYLGLLPTMLGLNGALIFGLILSVAWAPETKEVNLSKTSDIQLGS